MRSSESLVKTLNELLLRVVRGVRREFSANLIVVPLSSCLPLWKKFLMRMVTVPLLAVTGVSAMVLYWLIRSSPRPYTLPLFVVGSLTSGGSVMSM